MGYIERIYPDDDGGGWDVVIVTTSLRARRRNWVEPKNIGPYPTPADAIVGAVDTYLSPETAVRSGLRVLGIRPDHRVGDGIVTAHGHLVHLIRNRNRLLVGDTKGRLRLLKQIRHTLHLCGVAGCVVKS